MYGRVLLDTNVLFGTTLRGVLLLLADRDAFAPLWSERITEELRRALIRDRGWSTPRVDRLLEAMEHSFPEAAVAGWEPLEPAMENDPGDRHVLAAAVAGGATMIVTENLRHFPPAACADHGVVVAHPDVFLSHLLSSDPWPTLHTVVAFAVSLRSPRFTTADVLGRLEWMRHTTFADEGRRLLRLLPSDGPRRWYSATRSPWPSPPVNGGGRWYFVRTDPRPCPGDGCDMVAVTLMHRHRTVVWPDDDHPDLRARLRESDAYGTDVVAWSEPIGPVVAFSDVEAHRPLRLHG